MATSQPLPSGTHILSGIESQRLRAFCSSAVWTSSDLDAYANLLQRGPLSAIRSDFSQRVQSAPLDTSNNDSSTSDTGIDHARQSLATLSYGPTKIPLFNYLLQLTHLNPTSRALYLETTRFLALEAKVPVDSLDLSGTSAFMWAISTKPYWDPEFASIMLEAGASINRRNRYGCTAAHDIVMAMDYSFEGKKKTVDALRWFVEKGGDLDVKDGDGVSARVIGGKVLRLVPEMAGVLYGGGETATVPSASRGGAKKVGRNDPCPCGKGKKFKACCGKN